MRARAVPSSQIERMWGFGSLAARMAFGVVTESASRTFNGESNTNTTTRSSLSDTNAERLAEALCRMRGAALKLGQMLSLQDETMMPSSLQKALERVRQSADYMPKHQLETQLISQLGNNWKDNFIEFDEIPIAAASIGNSPINHSLLLFFHSSKCHSFGLIIETIYSIANNIFSFFNSSFIDS